MSEKRRDKKNRILRNGESQRPDGRYQYTYYDNTGIRRIVYNWRLDRTDATPSGKRPELSLREKEKQIQADLFNQVAVNGGDITVLELVKKYVKTRTGIRPSTAAGYKTCINFLSKNPFGSLRIDKVKMTDAKCWLIDLQKNGRGYSSLHTFRGILRPAFEIAYQDDLIRKNPFQFALADVLINDQVTRDAISKREMNEFLDYVKNDKHYCRYYDAFYVLFHTGLRISEFCGLTYNDIHFDEMYINVDHQLQRTSGMEYIIIPTKTNAGTRRVPMTKEVAACFERMIGSRPALRKEPVIDGYTGFLCVDKNGMPKVAMHWEKYFKFALEKHDRIYRLRFPKITPHVCRHTFCSNMARSGMNPKTLQYIMGHSDITVTMNTYTHVKYDDAKEEFARVTAIG